MRPACLPESIISRLRPRRGREPASFTRFAVSSSPPPPAPQFRNIAEVLQRRAAERPMQRAFVFLENAHDRVGASEIAWSYGELDRRARAIAAAVSRRAAPGDRAVLAFQPGLDFLAAFFGCLYAGVLPAPATYPRPRRASSRLDSIVADCTPRLGLSTSDTLASMPLDEQSAAVRALSWIAVDQCPRTDDQSSPLFDARPDDPAFLQYTSGSTSEPRGVVVTHCNLLHNLESIRQGFDLPAAGAAATPPTAAFWLPAYHDMGLIGGILSPLFVGGTAHLLAPAAFLQRPMSWLETISRTGATVSGAPNFAYELCTRKTTVEDRGQLDLSKWRVAFCGAEPIDPRVLEEFAAAMAPAGFRDDAFYPSYGLAESTLLVAGGAGPSRPRTFRANRAKLAAGELVDVDPQAADAQLLVSCGRALGGQDVRIVDPKSRRPCAAGVVGEIWVRGPSVAREYWNRSDESSQTFGGRLDDGAGPYLRTGDLGAVRDGELFITGRLKDLIIVRGRNLYPQDVERSVQQSHAAVEMGAAFSMVVDGAEQLVVVHQTDREHRRVDMAPVLRAMRAAIVDEHEVDPYAVVLLAPAALPITSSGKVQRSRCRELFEAGSLNELAAWRRSDERVHAAASEEAHCTAGIPPRPKFLDRIHSYSAPALATEIEAWMLALLADRVDGGAEQLSPDATFTQLGMDSLTAIELSVEFERVLCLRLPPGAAWSHPTPAGLSRYMADELLGVASKGPGCAAPVDSWFEAMEADARRR
jgi:acyl-CoA synthetase (AMP-forming)/AMP-acid ligase II/acyl carrier protein